LIKSKIKICGIRKIDTIDCCIKNEVDFFGLIFYRKSPRNISIDGAKILLDYSKNKNISSVGVFVNEKIENLNKLLKNLKLDFIQLHGAENDTYIQAIKKNHDIKIIKAISIQNKNDFEKTLHYKKVDMFLFDYKPSKNELPGGNAKKFNWSLLKNIKINKPFFLSGGISIKNINNIKKYIIPYGIDISSGVEVKSGIKNNTKITSLINSYE